MNSVLGDAKPTEVGWCTPKGGFCQPTLGGLRFVAPNSFGAGGGRNEARNKGEAPAVPFVVALAIGSVYDETG